MSLSQGSFRGAAIVAGGARTSTGDSKADVSNHERQAAPHELVAAASSLHESGVHAAGVTTFPSRPRTILAPKPRVKPGVSPGLLSEIQSFVLPALIVVSALLAKISYFDMNFMVSNSLSYYMGTGLFAALVFALVAGSTELNQTAGLVSGKVYLREIVTTIALSFLGLLGLLYLLKVSDQYSRAWFVVWFFLSVILVVAGRLAILLWARLLRAENRLLQRIAVFGSPDLAQRVVDQLFVNDANLVLAGVFTDDPRAPTSNIPIAGGMDVLIARAQEGLFDRVILALPRNASAKIRDAISSLEVLPLEVQFSPDALTLPCQVHGLQEANGLVLLDLQRRPMNARGMIIKSAMDYILSPIALVLLSPLMCMIAIAIKLDTRGPVFFIQSRHGYNHRIIRVIKFRTMTVAEDGDVVTQAVKGDNRVTRVGRFLRRSSLDELPQLFNVLRGELSLIGPRPHAVSHNESYTKIINRYATRHKVLPGITGWAQVNGFRGETQTPDAMRQRLDLDLYYISHWSLWLDVKILLKTLLVPFTSKNAY